ncbi:MAG: carboxypeptidase-like regulatory domain-containing protein, partial [Planctomycetota bacterium]
MRRSVLLILIAVLLAGLSLLTLYSLADFGGPAEPPEPTSATPAPPEATTPVAEVGLSAAEGRTSVEPTTGPSIVGRLLLPTGAGNDPVAVLALPGNLSSREALEAARRTIDRDPEAEESDRPLARTESDGSGRFQLTLPEGLELVRLAAIGPRCFLPEPELVVPDSEPRTYRCQLGVQVLGRVTDPLGQPLADAVIELGINRALVGSFPPSFMVKGRRTVTDVDGAFAFQSTALLDCFEVVVRPYASAGTVLDVGPLEPGIDRELEIRLSPGIDVVGRVVDAETGEPIPSAEVVIEKRDSTGSKGRARGEVEAGSDGRFEIERVSLERTLGRARADGYRERAFELEGTPLGEARDLGAVALESGDVVTG